MNNTQTTTQTTLLSAKSNYDSNTQSSPIDISYADYNDNTDTTLERNNYPKDIISMLKKNHQIFKDDQLDISTTYKYKMIGDDECKYWYIFLNITPLSKSKVKLEWAQTADNLSSSYSVSLLFPHIIIYVDNDLNWTTIEIQEYIEGNYAGDNASAPYYYLEKSTDKTRSYDRFTITSTDYKYIDINRVIEKAIPLDCSATTGLSQNQTKTKKLYRFFKSNR